MMIGVYIREFNSFSKVALTADVLKWSDWPPVCCGIGYFGPERQRDILLNLWSI